MNKKLYLIFSLSLIAVSSCQKAPTVEQLQGKWTEDTVSPDKNKLYFVSDSRLYFSHSGKIDTLDYSLDTKHKTMYLNDAKDPTKGLGTWSVVYFKKKHALSVTGISYSTGSSTQKTIYYLKD